MLPTSIDSARLQHILWIHRVERTMSLYVCIGQSQSSEIKVLPIRLTGCLFASIYRISHQDQEELQVFQDQR